MGINFKKPFFCGIEKKNSENKSKCLYKTQYLHLKQTDHGWIYAHRPNAKGAVMIVPVSHEKNPKTGIYEDYITFLETKRPPINSEGIADTCIELPAGLVGDENSKESFIEAAVKELREETGCVAKSLDIIADNCVSSPGCVSEKFAIVLATGVEKVEEPKFNDGGVIIKRHKVPAKEAMSWLQKCMRERKAVGGQTYAGMAFVLNSLMQRFN